MAETTDQELSRKQKAAVARTEFEYAILRTIQEHGAELSSSEVLASMAEIAARLARAAAAPRRGKGTPI